METWSTQSRDYLRRSERAWSDQRVARPGGAAAKEHARAERAARTADAHLRSRPLAWVAAAIAAATHAIPRRHARAKGPQPAD